MSNSNSTTIEDRPWDVGKAYLLDSDDCIECEPDIIEIICYLDEDCPVAPTEFVYKHLHGTCIGMHFKSEVSYMLERDWIKPLELKHKWTL